MSLTLNGNGAKPSLPVRYQNVGIKIQIFVCNAIKAATTEATPNPKIRRKGSSDPINVPVTNAPMSPVVTRMPETMRASDKFWLSGAGITTWERYSRLLVEQS